MRFSIIKSIKGKIICLMTILGFILSFQTTTTSAYGQVLDGAQFKALLEDETDGKPIRETSFPVKPSGIAYSKLENGVVEVLAVFKDLPDPQGGDFYEGWIYGGFFDAVSTGKVEKINGVWQNHFRVSEKKYIKYKKYILTIEPNDNNEDPEEHVVEGKFKEIK